MRIVLDANPALSEHYSGLRTLLAGLLGGLVELPEINRICMMYSARATSFASEVPAWRHPKVRRAKIPIRMLYLRDWWRLCPWWPSMELLTLGKADIFHSIHNLMPPVRRARRVITVHDLRRYRLPELYPGSKVREFETAVSMADRIMTISESTKKDLVEFLHVDPEKIDVTYLGTPEGFAPAPEQKREETRRRLGQILGRNVGGYAVVMSAGDRRKNSPGTVKAFAQACRELPDDYCMVVIGTPPKDGSLERAIEENSLRHRVFHLGHIDQSEYVDILSAAGMLAFMSFYEGFGLPLLEAMACGVPVLTSSVSSMPEVAGDAALLADPRDPADIASQMVRLAADQPLRRGLIEKGFERVRRFTWLQCAKDTLACYQRTLNGPGR